MNEQEKKEIWQAVHEVMREEVVPIIRDMVKREVETYMQDQTAKTNVDYIKLDTLDRYLNILYGAEQVGHAVHKEIAEALTLYRKEALGE